MQPERQVALGSGAWAAFILVLAHLALALAGGRSTGSTIDEPNYFNSGRGILRHGCVTEVSRIQGPLALMASQLFVREFPPGGLGEHGPRSALLRGRLGTLPFALLSVLVVFLWARALFGTQGGIVALTFAAFDPLLLGYDGLLLVDAHHTAFVVLVLFLTWCHLETGSWRMLVLLGVALGAALATKYLALFLVAPVLVLVAVRSFRAGATHDGALRLQRVRWAAPLLVAGLALLTLHALYFFREPFASTDPADHASRALRGMLSTPLGAPLALLPAAFVNGVDYIAHHAEGPWRPYLAGEFAEGHPGYYLFLLLTKLPELVWLGIALVIVRIPRLLRLPIRGALLNAAAVTLSYGLPFFGYLSFANRMQFGVRYVVPLVALVCVWLGALALRTKGEPLSRRGFFGLCALIVGVHAVELRRAWPDWIHYANRSSGGKEHAYRWFRDTNTDFGQYRWSGPAQLEARLGPLGFLDARSGARVGRLALDIEALATKDAFDPTRSRFDWLTLRAPIAHLGSSWYVFECTSAQLEESLAHHDDPLVRRALVLCLLGEGELERARAHLARLEASTVREAASLIRCLELAAASPGPAQLDALVQAWLRADRPDKVVELAVLHPQLASSRAFRRGLALAHAERREFGRAAEILEAVEPELEDLRLLVAIYKQLPNRERILELAVELERRLDAAGEPSSALALLRARIEMYRQGKAFIE